MVSTSGSGESEGKGLSLVWPEGPACPLTPRVLAGAGAEMTLRLSAHFGVFGSAPLLHGCNFSSPHPHAFFTWAEVLELVKDGRAGAAERVVTSVGTGLSFLALPLSTLPLSVRRRHRDFTPGNMPVAGCGSGTWPYTIPVERGLCQGPQ